MSQHAITGEYSLALSDDKKRVMELYGRGLNRPDRIHYPEAEPNDILLQQLLARKALGAHVVLVDGAFDVPHPSHEWYLRHCRAFAAESSLEQKGVPSTNESLRIAISSTQTMLIATVDADAKIAEKKEKILSKDPLLAQYTHGLLAPIG